MTTTLGIIPRKVTDDSVMGREATLALVEGLVRALGEAEIGRVDDPLIQAAARRKLEEFIASLGAGLPWTNELTGFPVLSGGVMRYRDLKAWCKRVPGMTWGKTSLAEITFRLVGDVLELGSKDAVVFAQERIDEIARQCKTEHDGKLTRKALEKHLVKTLGISGNRVRTIIKGAGGVKSIYERIEHQRTANRPKGLKYGRTNKK